MTEKYPMKMTDVTPWSTSDGRVHLSESAAIAHEEALHNLIGFLVYVKEDRTPLMTLRGMVVVNAANHHKMMVEHFMSEHFGPRIMYVDPQCPTSFKNHNSMYLAEMWYINHNVIKYSDFGSIRQLARIEDVSAKFVLWGPGVHMNHKSSVQSLSM